MAEKDPPSTSYITVRECSERHMTLEKRLSSIDVSIKSFKWQVSTLIIIVNILLVVMMKLWK